MKIKELLTVDNLKKYFKNWWIGLDQWINTWFGGDPDETMSSQLGKRKDLKYAKPFYLIINFIAYKVFGQKNHCEQSIEPDEGEDAVLK